MKWVGGRSFSVRLFLGGFLLLLLITTRWAWIDCDGGIPSLNEYGYFATDEGYYCGGGKMKLLRGKFISAVRASPCTYAICPSTHLMTWGAFNIFGQTTWAHRFFPFLLCSSAWMALFFYLSRRILPWIAFAWCAVFVLNPFLMVYSRTACNDTIMGSLLLLGYILTRKNGKAAALAGGFVFGLGLWVKMSIWVLFPLGLSAAAMSLQRRLRLPRMGLFLIGFAASACLQYLLIRFMILEDALNQNHTVSELLKISNTSYALPDVFDWELWIKSLSSFPRCPTDGTLGLWIALFLLLPSLMLLRRLAERPFHWDGRLILYATPPIYTAGILFLPLYYSHYFIPVIMFVPIIWLEARHDLKRWSCGKWQLATGLATAALNAILIAYYTFKVHPAEANKLANYIATAYQLPVTCVWVWNGLYILCGAALLTVLTLWARQRKPTIWIILGAFISALLVADICFSSIPLCEAYKYIQIYSARIRQIAFSLQATSILLLFAVWAMPGFFRAHMRWHLLLPALLVAGILMNSVWRNAMGELTQRGQLHKQAAAELDRLLPDNAVVFGERAPQVFLSLQPRVSGLPTSNPVPFLYAMNEKYPTFPLYALIDSEHNYHYVHYEKHKDKIRMEVLHTLKLPSFNSGLPVDVFLVRLHLLDRPPHRALNPR
jgi:4-amino-4-deoxy-L-arabinose transferase-like glycosyltransferase